jgi:hypothetical protein
MREQRIPLSTVFMGLSLETALPFVVDKTAQEKTDAPREEKEDDFQRRVLGVDCLKIDEPGRDKPNDAKQHN